jgi:ADP-heptose:LPS heptosyltransferase
MKRALLIHAGAVGDFILSLRIVQALRQAGAEHVTVLGRPEIAAVAIPGGKVDAVLDLDTGGYHTLFSDSTALPQSVRDSLRSFDTAVNMLGGADDASSARLSQAGIQRIVSIDPRPRPGCAVHITEQWLGDLRAAGINAAPGPPSLQPDAAALHAARDKLERTLAKPEAPIAILHPGSGSPKKCWPLTRFLELARVLRSRALQPVFLIGPVEEERLTREQAQSLREAAPTLRPGPLLEAAGLIAAARLFVGNDSGMSHLAAALGIGSVVIFGPTDPVVWRPLGESVTVVGPQDTDDWPNVDQVSRTARRYC